MADEQELPESDPATDNLFTEAAAAELVDPPVETPAEPIVPETDPAQDAFDSLLENAREAGLSTDGINSDAELAAAMLSQLKDQQPLVGYAKQLLPHADEIKTYFDSQTNPAKPDPEPSDEWDTAAYLKERYGGPGWKAEFDEAIEQGLVESDANTGMWVPAPGKEMLATPILNEMNSAMIHRSSFWKKMSSGNPYEQFYDVLKEPLQREMEARVNEILAQRESQSSQTNVIDSFEADNASWLYATDPQTGSRVNTEKGQAFIDTVNSLRSDGIEDPAKLIAHASLIHGVGKETPSVAPAPPKEEPKSFLDSARQRAEHAPSARQRGGDGAAPQSMTQGDLDSLFVRAHRETVSN